MDLDITTKKNRIFINLCGVLFCFFLKKKKKEEENRFLIGKEKKNLEVAEKKSHTNNKLCSSLNLRNSAPIKKKESKSQTLKGFLEK
jgi:hypothetical protein